MEIMSYLPFMLVIMGVVLIQIGGGTLDKKRVYKSCHGLGFHYKKFIECNKPQLVSIFLGLLLVIVAVSSAINSH